MKTFSAKSTLAMGSFAALCAFSVPAQTTAFTYQGELRNNGQAATGLCDLVFSLHDASSGGSQVGLFVTNTAVTLEEGRFTVSLDFGSSVFSGADRWLQIGVRTNGGTGAFTTLSPRQGVSPHPYALHAKSVEGSTITGIVPNSRLPANLVRTDPGMVEMEAEFIFRGPVEFQNASGPPFVLTGSQELVLGLNAERLGDRTAQGFWQTGGNAGTTPSSDFLGTTDNQPLEFKVNGQRALRLEPGGSNSVSVIGGWRGNSVAAGVVGATVGGGGAGDYIGQACMNRVESDFGTVSGGGLNLIQSNARYATIGGGFVNTVQAGATRATIGGGVGNMIQTDAYDATIGGGDGNTIQANTSYSTIGGGYQNLIQTNAYGATIAGGNHHVIQTNTSFATISGGFWNAVADNVDFATIAGGEHNLIDEGARHASIGGGNSNSVLRASSAAIAGGELNKIQNAYGAVIGGGAANEITTYAEYAVIPGGYQNRASGYFSLAAGLRAKANHDGAFVWADYTAADFASSHANEFAVRANGGVRIDCGSGTGISLNAADRPFITRGHDPFTGGKYEGAGRWGVFMEPHTLVAGIPAIANKSFRVCSYNADSTINKTLAVVDQVGNVSATAFNPTSDRNAKENFAKINPKEVLEKVAALPISRWNFKQDPDAEHVGPMAQDFHAAFGMGADDKHIATVDADGVALAAIQGLNEKVESGKWKAESSIRKLEERLRQKDAEIIELRGRLDKLEQLLNTITRTGNASLL